MMEKSVETKIFELDLDELEPFLERRRTLLSPSKCKIMFAEIARIVWKNRWGDHECELYEYLKKHDPSIPILDRKIKEFEFRFPRPEFPPSKHANYIMTNVKKFDHDPVWLAAFCSSVEKKLEKVETEKRNIIMSIVNEKLKGRR